MLGFHLTPQSQTTSEITDKIWNIVVKQGLEENYGEYWDKTQILREFNKYGSSAKNFLKHRSQAIVCVLHTNREH